MVSIGKCALFCRLSDVISTHGGALPFGFAQEIVAFLVAGEAENGHVLDEGGRRAHPLHALIVIDAHLRAAAHADDGVHRRQFDPARYT